MKRIAVIDDDDILRKVVTTTLLDRGYTLAWEATNGEEAIKKSVEDPPDVFIMDVVMPGMSGIETAALIAAGADYGAAVVLLTGSGADKAAELGAEAGVMACLSKPFKAEDLVAAIELASVRRLELKELKSDNLKLTEAIEARKVIEKAKGSLMKNEGITEEKAYSRLRKISMDRRISMKEVSEIILAGMGE